jgi:hypothetical protein
MNQRTAKAMAMMAAISILDLECRNPTDITMRFSDKDQAKVLDELEKIKQQIAVKFQRFSDWEALEDNFDRATLNTP